MQDHPKLIWAMYIVCLEILLLVLLVGVNLFLHVLSLQSFIIEELIINAVIFSQLAVQLAMRRWIMGRRKERELWRTKNNLPT
ncbi:hypothetical protein KSD_90140 [Ktedonobacter sp. SOSP1-85]|nr:hypothetical protein KSD_90140 [Ktedonobacter sp. SOSP1-85]